VNALDSDPGLVSTAYLLAMQPAEWWDSLPERVRLALLWILDPWSRPDQVIPEHAWRTCGLTGGRGFGKTRSVGKYINGRVMAGLESHVALMAPTEPRTQEVQVKALTDYAAPWARPVPFTRLKTAGLRWPNGVEAVFFTPESPGRSRSENISLCWLTEIVDWKPSTREEAFGNIYTATRVGEARVIWDSTAKGRNEVRAKLEEWHASDPEQHVILPGEMFDNPLLSSAYLRSQWLMYSGVRREEELMGRSFREAAGALWKQKYFDASRVAEAPDLDWTLVVVDPAISTHDSSDETGIMYGGRAKDGHAYVIEDLSGTHPFETWGDLAVDRAHPSRRGAGRIGIERKRIGDGAVGCIKSRAENRGLRVRVIGKDDPWPAWDPGFIFVREYSPQESKGTRAEGPAAETEAGRVHLVDAAHSEAPRFADLEAECTTYVPGATKRSPNRLDAFAYLISELRELRLDSPPDHGRDAAAAVAMQAELERQLRGATLPGQVVSALAGTRPGSGIVGGGRRMGL
jgi:phage terminase large subunit-like protein